MYNPKEFDDYRPNVGVTVIPVIYKDGELKVLAYARSSDAEEFSDTLAFPNGFFNRQKHNTAEEAAIDALKMKADAKLAHFEQLETFSGNYIDPNRITTVNITYFALLKPNEVSFDEAGAGQWLSIESLLSLSEIEFAFNHKEVLECAYERIKAKADYSPVALNLLPDEFTINDFLLLTQTLMGRTINEKTFRTKLQKSELLISTGRKHAASKQQRPSMLYRINPDFEGCFYPRALFN
ncbi:NUDIX hydrolase [Vibrio owensii]|uniref:NUDIX hydrolase n=1 Tax=Vibrio harveyi group TaxID=717610 RepID=UPI003CC589B4